MKFTKETASKLGKKSSRKGVPNKNTLEIREAFRQLLEAQSPKLTKWIEAVADEDPAKAIDLLLKMSEYILPKLQRTEIQTEINIQTLLELTPQQRQERILELKNKLN